MRIKVQPISVNECYYGRRYKTKKYKAFEQEVMLKLKPQDVPDGDLTLSLLFGVSNPRRDLDNMIKNFQDILQKKYGFNDNRVYRLVVVKEIVAKGDEFIEFEISGEIT